MDIWQPEPAIDAPECPSKCPWGYPRPRLPSVPLHLPGDERTRPGASGTLRQSPGDAWCPQNPAKCSSFRGSKVGVPFSPRHAALAGVRELAHRPLGHQESAREPLKMPLRESRDRSSIRSVTVARTSPGPVHSPKANTCTRQAHLSVSTAAVPNKFSYSIQKTAGGSDLKLEITGRGGGECRSVSSSV